MQRRFAIIGHDALGSGDLRLNDLAGGSGRMDVLVRAVNTALFLSHGIRRDSHITLHLTGGQGPFRRVWFDGSTLRGVRPDERSIAGHIRSIMKRQIPPIGTWEEVSGGISHSGGDLSDTLGEWSREGVNTYVLDSLGSSFEEALQDAPVGFILSDHLPFSVKENDSLQACQRLSIGTEWLQGHACIAIVHHLLDG